MTLITSFLQTHSSYAADKEFQDWRRLRVAAELMIVPVPAYRQFQSMDHLIAAMQYLWKQEVIILGY